MAASTDRTVLDKLIEFYQIYCEDDIAKLSQAYPSEQKSLYINWKDEPI
jgi:replicative DNA helicase Mcm